MRERQKGRKKGKNKWGLQRERKVETNKRMREKRNMDKEKG